MLGEICDTCGDNFFPRQIDRRDELTGNELTAATNWPRRTDRDELTGDELNGHGVVVPRHSNAAGNQGCHMAVAMAKKLKSDDV